MGKSDTFDIANEVARRLGEKMDGLPLSFIGEALFNTSSTAHILGGCCMGATPDKGVVGFTGLKSRIEGLSVSGNPVQSSTRPRMAFTRPRLTLPSSRFSLDPRVGRVGLRLRRGTAMPAISS